MNRKSIAVALTLLTAATSAIAQHSMAPNDTTIAKTYELGEVQVSASRNNAKVKEIPASISVISSQAIAETGMKTLSGLTATTPNVFMGDYGSKLTSPIYIRGIGSKINAPSVGLYVDHVPYFDKATFAFDFFDVEQIEVLRGPQGTLYGRNTMGGIINIITRSPLDYQGTTLNLSAGTYGSYNVSGGHYGKVGDKFGYSLALNYQHNDGFYTNSYNNTLVDNLNSFGGRNRLIWNITKRLSVENIASYERSRQGGYPYALLDPATGKANPIKYNEYSYYNRDMFSDAVVVKYDAPAYEVLSTTSYQYFKDRQAIDQDFSEKSVYYINYYQKQNMVSQEAIIRSKGAKRISWLFGAYGFAQFFDNNVEATYYTKNAIDKKSYLHDIMGFALFHQLTIADFLVKNLSLTGGIRLDGERDKMEYEYNTLSLANGIQKNLADTTYPALKTLEVIPKVALTYKLGVSNIYAAISRGYKTGGFNTSFERPEDLKFNSEHSINYEVGVKSPFLGNHFYGELALFYIDWTNQQVTIPLPSGRGVMLKNAGKSYSRGLESSLRLLPIAGFDASVSYGLTNAAFTKYMQGNVDLSGNYTPCVPKHTVGAQAGKTFTLSNNTILDKIRIGVTYRGAGAFYWTEKNNHKQPYYSILDSKISFIRKNIQLDLWGRNLTDTDYESYYFEMAPNSFIQSGRPMQLGVNLSVNF
jgi:iron complex outermembrane recepter protein